jgi:hypothetical protein
VLTERMRWGGGDRTVKNTVSELSEMKVHTKEEKRDITTTMGMLGGAAKQHEQHATVWSVNRHENSYYQK